jgi:type I restriction enzyme S subunit
MNQLVRLGDFCEQDRNTVRPGEGSELRYIGLETIESGTGQFQNGELSKTPEIPQANSFRFRPEHVLYGKLRPYLNKVALPDFDGKCSTEIIPLKPKPGLDRRYLFYFLRSADVVDRISRKTAGARMPRADMDFVLELQLPLPPLEEQRRVVDLLARAEGIVRLRRDAQKKAAEIIPALFLDMFGDPATNARGWATRRVRDLVARFEGGKNLRAADDGGTQFQILKVSAVTSGRYIESESKPTPAGYEPPANHIVRGGDMLFSRANTQQLVGATAIVEATDGHTLLPDKLWRFIWAEDVDQRYMHALFQSKHVRAELGKLSTGTSGSMRNVSQEKLFSLRLPIAPLDRQRAFGRRAEAMRAVVAQQEAAVRHADSLFRALLARFLSGGEQQERLPSEEAAVT